MIRSALTTLALLLLTVVLTATPAQAREWNWTQAHNAPVLVVCKFWHPSTSYGPLWEVKSVGINNTAGPGSVSVSVRRGSVNGPVIHHWAANLASGQWSAMGTVFLSPIAGDILMTSSGTPSGGAGGDLGIEYVTHC